jgi:hypothetical protein
MTHLHPKSAAVAEPTPVVAAPALRRKVVFVGKSPKPTYGAPTRP